MNTGKSVAIVQSNYIPWKGYFDLIRSVDEFVLLDDVQFTKRDWRNRNKIKTSTGVKWLTIPVKVKGRFCQPINETEVVDGSWADSHWSKLSQTYRHASYYNDYSSRIEAIYEKASKLDLLSDINELFIKAFCQFLSVDTRIRRSSEFDLEEGKNNRLIGICKDIGAQNYMSGPNAKGYIDAELFAMNGISVEWKSYDRYLSYRQLYDGFIHEVSLLDVIFCCGPYSKDMIFQRGV